MSAKRHWRLADENRQIAEKLQSDIDQLQKKKEALLRNHNEK